jgi:hypothetical protein
VQIVSGHADAMFLMQCLGFAAGFFLSICRQFFHFRKKSMVEQGSQL